MADKKRGKVQERHVEHSRFSFFGHKMKTEAKSSNGALQKVKEESGLPIPIKQEVEEKEHKVKVEEEKVMPCSAGASDMSSHRPAGRWVIK